GDVAAVKFVLAELRTLTASQASPATASAVPHSMWRSARLTAAVAALTALVVGSGAWLLRPQPNPPMVARLSITLPDGQFFSGTTRPLVAVSPDGSQVAYVANARI